MFSHIQPEDTNTFTFSIIGLLTSQFSYKFYCVTKI